MKKLWLLFLFLCLPVSAFPQTSGYLVRANCSQITDPVANSTVCLQNTTASGRTAGTLYVWNGSAWVVASGSGGSTTISGLTNNVLPKSNSAGTNLVDSMVKECNTTETCVGNVSVNGAKIDPSAVTGQKSYTLPNTAGQLAVAPLIQAGAYTYCIGAGTNTYTCGLTPPANVSLVDYLPGMGVDFVPANTNSGASTLNIDGLGAKSILTSGGGAVSSGALVAGSVYRLVYTSGAFRMAQDLDTGGTGVPAGSNTQVQRNNGGAFGGISGATSDGTSMTFGDGNLKVSGGTSGTMIIKAPATGGGTVTGPTGTATLVGKDTTDTLTNKTYDTAGTGNVFKVNGATVTDLTGGSLAIASAHLTLSGDSAAPGNSKCYSTDSGGTKGWNNCSAASSATIVTVTNSTNQILTAGNWTFIAFDTDVEDVADLHNQATNNSRITFAATTKCTINVNVSITTGSISIGDYILDIMLNGATVIGRARQYAATNTAVLDFDLTRIKSFTTNDYIQARIFVGGNDNAILNATSAFTPYLTVLCN